jgi:hypothetical protein
MDSALTQQPDAQSQAFDGSPFNRREVEHLTFYKWLHHAQRVGGRLDGDAKYPYVNTQPLTPAQLTATPSTL